MAAALALRGDRHYIGGEKRAIGAKRSMRVKLS